MWRNYRVAVSSSREKQWLQIIVDFLDSQGRQRSRTVKSYGQFTPGNFKLASEWVGLLKQVASQDSDPIPIGTTDEALWEGFYQGINGFPWTLAVAPLLALRDILDIGGYAVDSSLGNIDALVERTQRHMSPTEKQRFISWLQGTQLNKRECIAVLNFKWWWQITDGEGDVILTI
jgi:hypothetical protein